MRDATLLPLCSVHTVAANKDLCANSQIRCRYFETFVWPHHLEYNEGLADMTHPMTACAFHVTDANLPEDAVFEQVHRILTRY